MVSISDPDCEADAEKEWVREVDLVLERRENVADAVRVAVDDKLTVCDLESVREVVLETDADAVAVLDADLLVDRVSVADADFVRVELAVLVGEVLPDKVRSGVHVAVDDAERLGE